jgi:hypothetical protein
MIFYMILKKKNRSTGFLWLLAPAFILFIVHGIAVFLVSPWSLNSYGSVVFPLFFLLIAWVVLIFLKTHPAARTSVAVRRRLPRFIITRVTGITFIIFILSFIFIRNSSITFEPSELSSGPFFFDYPADFYYGNVFLPGANLFRNGINVFEYERPSAVIVANILNRDDNMIQDEKEKSLQNFYQSFAHFNESSPVTDYAIEPIEIGGVSGHEVTFLVRPGPDEHRWWGMVRFVYYEWRNRTIVFGAAELGRDTLTEIPYFNRLLKTFQIDED